MRSKRHALGQHFLINSKVIQKIVDQVVHECEQSQIDGLLEIGPGKGAITLPLIQTQKIPPFFLAEKDYGFIEYWKNEKNIPVIEGDFLKIDWRAHLPFKRFGVVSNLPYSAGTGITLDLMNDADQIPFMVLMYQAEVAKRFRAKEQTKEWGSLSLWTQNLWDVELLIPVPPGAFKPPPKVNSEVIVFHPRKEPRIQGTENPDQKELWNRLLRRAFQQQRKMLRSTLGKDPKWQNALEASGLDGTKRAEALTWDEWNQLFQSVLNS